MSPMVTVSATPESSHASFIVIQSRKSFPMRYELVHRGVSFSVTDIDETPPKWRWWLHPAKVFGSINRVEGGQVVGTRADAEAVARKAIETYVTA